MMDIIKQVDKMQAVFFLTESLFCYHGHLKTQHFQNESLREVMIDSPSVSHSQSYKCIITHLIKHFLSHDL